MEQNVILPPYDLVFSITSVVVVVHDFGMVPIGWQYVYCDLFASVLHLKGRIQDRIGIPIASQQWLLFQGDEIFNDNILAHFDLMSPHAIFSLVTSDDWPPPDFPLHLLLPLPPPPDPQNDNQQQPESQSHTYDSTSSNNSNNDADNAVVGGGMPEVVNGGVNLQVCDSCVSVINKLVNVSRSHILCDIFDNTNMSSFLASVFARMDHHVLVSALNIVQTVFFSLENISAILDQITRPRPTYADIPTKHGMPHPCLRIQFVKGDGEADLCDDSLDAVITEPLTSFDAIGRYLWPQVNARREDAQTAFAGNIVDGSEDDSRKAEEQSLPEIKATPKRQKSVDASSSCSASANKEYHGSCSVDNSHQKLIFAVTVCPVPLSEFVSSKMTNKLEQQMVNPLDVSDGAMPSQCSQLMAECPILFSFEARNRYFLLTSLSSPLVQSHSSTPSNCNSSPSDARCSLVGNFPLKKFRVHRTLILNSAARMIDAYGPQNVTLEVEYTEEVGTGLGTTLEFYILVCHGCQKLGLGMWREDHSFPSSGENVEPGFIVASFGPFLWPWSATMDSSDGVNFSEVLKRFVLLGNVVAKALQDGRLLDLPLSKAFYKLPLIQDLNIYDIQSLDPGLGRVLLEFQALVDRKRIMSPISAFYFRNPKVDDLCLDFTQPGYPDYLVTSNQDRRMVNTKIEKYVSLIVDATLNSGILRQAEAFKCGFNQELDYLVGAVLSPGRPFVAIVFCSKLSSEIGVTGSLLEKVDVLIIGGRMVFTFQRSQNYSVRTSPMEEDKVCLAKSLRLKASPRRVQLVLPLDIILVDKFAPDANNKRVGMYAMLEGWMGLDIGSVSNDINNGHLDKAKTVMWYGIMMVVGMEKFARRAQLATGGEPLYDEPMWGLAFIVEANVIPLEEHSSESDVSTEQAHQYGIFTGQIMTVVKEACRTNVLQKQPRLVEPMYFCELNTPTHQIGPIYGVLSKRRARVLKEEMQERSSLLTVHVYVHKSIEKRDPEFQVLYLYLSHWEELSEDPLFVPKADGSKYNKARKLIDAERSCSGRKSSATCHQAEATFS